MRAPIPFANGILFHDGFVPFSPKSEDTPWNVPFEVAGVMVGNEFPKKQSSSKYRTKSLASTRNPMSSAAIAPLSQK